jgi:hypothetical protein
LNTLQPEILFAAFRALTEPLEYTALAGTPAMSDLSRMSHPLMTLLLLPLTPFDVLNKTVPLVKDVF